MANAQLQLITIDEEQWKLDPRTIRVGRKGLAQARAVLARSLATAAAEAPRADAA